MQNIYIEELNALALEFKSLRESGIRRFPESSWQKVVAFTKKMPIADISQTIDIPACYINRRFKVELRQL